MLKFFNYLKLVYRSFYRYRYTKCVKAQLYHSEQSCVTVNYVKYHGISPLLQYDLKTLTLIFFRL